MLSPRRVLFLVLLFSLALPSLAQAGVQPSYDLSTPDGGPFPSDRWTATDWSQPTGVRVNLPKPDCTARPSDCADIDVLNTLDGFNVQPRISIPFTGAIDPNSVSSSSVFLIRIPDHAITGINQIAWEPAADTLHVESDQLLRQRTVRRVAGEGGRRTRHAHEVVSHRGAVASVGLRRAQQLLGDVGAGPCRNPDGFQITRLHGQSLVAAAPTVIR